MRIRYFSRFELVGYFLVFVFTIILVLQFNKARETLLDAARQSFRMEQLAESRAIAVNVESSLRQVYQGLRTIARLPAVRELRHESARLQEDARVSAQEIYNNLAENLSVSELYIVPVDFNPNQLDRATGQPEKPLMTFDQLIVGRNADQKGKLHGGVEEIEIYEYREMRRQLDMLSDRYGTEESFSSLDYPAVISPKVITCDNRRFSPSAPNDEDRMGILYSVPYYGFDGNLRGIVTAVVLSAVLTELLPSGKHALVNENLDIVDGRQDGELWKAALKSGTADTGIRPTQSSMIPLRFPDLSGDWSLWSGVHATAFSESLQVRAINARYWMAISILLAGSVVIAVALRWLSQRQFAVETRNRELVSRIGERTAELAEATKAAEDANSAKSQFLARISHEIRTPMHAIISATELLEARDRDEKTTGKITIIKSASRALLDLVNQVLELSAIEHGKLELQIGDFSPVRLASETLEMMRASAERKDLRLQFHCDPRTPEVFRSDPARIRQILINLIGNAIKFTEAGSIVIEVGPVEYGGGSRRGLYFDVVDTGVGVPAERKEEIFDPFRRGEPDSSNTEGVGLGLAISAQLAKQLEGHIEVRDAEPSGAHFRLTVVELADAAGVFGGNKLQEAVHSADARGCSALKARILLAEDNERMRTLIGECLLHLGCEVDFAGDGLEAVQAIGKREYDVVLMDCSMPRLDGIEAVKLVRRKEAGDRNGHAHVPIIALTANAFDSDRQACLDAGMDDFLRKPFTQDELRHILAKQLNA